jgi:hypothetical protein
LQKAADYFNVNYRSILRHLDTKKITIKNGKLVLFFSNKLSLEEIKKIKVKSIKNENVNLWIYKKGLENNSNLVLINNKQPTFNYKYQAAKELKFTHRTISKYLDTGKSYNGLFFYSHRL